MVRKVVVIGPESTGKSYLCERLAEQFGTAWVPEYAREYLLQHGTRYSLQDLLVIAKGQLELEEKMVASAKNGIIFIDTNMYVMKVWCEYVFNACHEWILKRIVERQYDLYLLCNTDLPWVRDELREYPDLKARLELFHIYKDNMANQNTSWVEIKGEREHRLNMATEAVKSLHLSI
jgi:NadR type nicotinamide-nucleotide adenylyltransferase